MRRPSALAGSFYPATGERCKKDLVKYCDWKNQPLVEAPIVAGIVPHAGWSYSGAVAGKVYHAISKQRTPRTFIIFGAVHSYGTPTASIWKEGFWETPLGEIEIDKELGAAILDCKLDFLEDKPRVHLGEHSIEVQVPFVQHLFPGSKILPIMVSPFARAHELGERVAEVVGTSPDVVVLGSTDMSHYGVRFGFTSAGLGQKGLDWVKQVNDRRMLELICSLDAESIVPEASANHNCCGAGAIAATLGYARKQGKTRGELIEYTTSFDVYPERQDDSFVGYAGVVF